MADLFALVVGLNGPPGTPSGDVGLVDLTTATVVTSVTLGGGPSRVAITPDATTGLIINGSTLDSVSVPGLVTGPAPSLAAGGYRLAITPDGTRAYVTLSSFQMQRINIPAITAGAAFAIGGSAASGSDVGILPDGLAAYTADPVSGPSTSTQVTIPGEVVTTAATGLGVLAEAIAILPDGSRAYISGQGGIHGNGIYRMDFPSLTITLVATPSFSVSDMIATPDSTQVFLADNTANNVYPFDTGTDTLGSAIAVGTGPNGMAVSPDGTTLFVALRSVGEIGVVDVVSHVVGTAISVGGGPGDLAIVPAPPTPPVTPVTIPPLFIPRKTSLDPTDLDIDWLAIERWANALNP